MYAIVSESEFYSFLLTLDASALLKSVNEGAVKGCSSVISGTACYSIMLMPHARPFLL